MSTYSDKLFESTLKLNYLVNNHTKLKASGELEKVQLELDILNKECEALKPIEVIRPICIKTELKNLLNSIFESIIKFIGFIVFCYVLTSFASTLLYGN